MKQRLTVVLDLRRQAEDVAKRAVGHLERERADLVAEHAELERRLRSTVAADIPVALREQFSAFAAATRAAAIDLVERVARHDQLIAEARDRLATAHREVRAIEAIRARDRLADQRRELRREGRANDAFAARRWMEVSP